MGEARRLQSELGGSYSRKWVLARLIWLERWSRRRLWRYFPMLALERGIWIAQGRRPRTWERNKRHIRVMADYHEELRARQVRKEARI